MKRLSSLLLTTLVSTTVLYTLKPTRVYSSPLLVQANPAKDSSILQKKAEGLILGMSKKNYAQVRSELAPQLQRFWSPEKIQKQWEQSVLGAQGDFEKILKSKVVDIVDGTLVIVTVQFSSNTADLIVTFNSQEQVVGFDFPENLSVEQIAQTFVKSLSRKDYGAARHFLHPYLKTEFFPEKIQKRWQVLEQKSGDYQEILEMQIKPTSDQGTLVIIKIQFAKTIQEMILIFDKEKQITGIDIAEN